MQTPERKNRRKPSKFMEFNQLILNLLANNYSVPVIAEKISEELKETVKDRALYAFIERHNLREKAMRLKDQIKPMQEKEAVQATGEKGAVNQAANTAEANNELEERFKAFERKWSR